MPCHLGNLSACGSSNSAITFKYEKTAQMSSFAARDELMTKCSTEGYAIPMSSSRSLPETNSER